MTTPGNTVSSIAAKEVGEPFPKTVGHDPEKA
jgi:hypothetical protein